MSLKRVVLVGSFLVLSSIGCEHRDRSGSGGPESSRGAVDPCSNPAEGARLDGDRRCVEPPEALGCSDVPCGDLALLLAMAPDGSIWRFGNDCLPVGWNAIEDPSEDLRSAFEWPICGPAAPPGSCSTTPADECGRGDGCSPMRGQRFDGAVGCFLAPVAVGCSDGACADAAITWAFDLDGNLWRFTDGCVPAGWTELEEPPDTVPSATRADNCQ